MQIRASEWPSPQWIRVKGQITSALRAGWPRYFSDCVKTLAAAALAVSLNALVAAADAPAKADRTIAYRTAKIDGLDIFYREAGAKDAPVILLLHAYPSSSHMFRNLIPLLMDDFHIVAPDFPGYGQSTAPAVDKFPYTFQSFADITDKLVGQLGLTKYAIFCGPDVGSYVGFRLATKHPERVGALVIQNGEAYAESRNKEFWRPFEEFGRNRTAENAHHLHKHLSLEDNKWHYTHGGRNPESFSPDTWTLDFAILSRPGNPENRAALFYDTRSNLTDYAKWQAYFRDHQPPTLVVWGKNSGIVTADGGMFYKRDLKDVEIHAFDTGHFALEEDLYPISRLVRDFLDKTLKPHK